MSGPAQQTTVAAKMTIAYPGLISDAAHNKDVASAVSEEASAEIAFGRMVKKGTADSGALIPTANTNRMLGVVVHSHAYEKDQELGDTGLKPKITMGVMRHGRIFVEVDEDVTPTDAVRLRCDTNGGTVPGVFCKSASAGHTLNLSPLAAWVSSSFAYTPPGGSATKVAELELDITNISAATAD